MLMAIKLVLPQRYFHTHSKIYCLCILPFGLWAMSEKSCFVVGKQYKKILFAPIGDNDDGNDESLSFL